MNNHPQHSYKQAKPQTKTIIIVGKYFYGFYDGFY